MCKLHFKTTFIIIIFNTLIHTACNSFHFKQKKIHQTQTLILLQFPPLYLFCTYLSYFQYFFRKYKNSTLPQLYWLSTKTYHTYWMVKLGQFCYYLRSNANIISFT